MSKIMIDLSKDTQFVKDVSPLTKLKERQFQRKREEKLHKLNIIRNNGLAIEVIDPLKVELETYKQQTIIKRRKNEASSGRQMLRNYILQQQKDLKCLRVDKPYQPKSQRKFQTLSTTIPIKNTAIDIPQIKQIFSNQQKQYMLFEKKLLRKKLGKAISSIENNIISNRNLFDEFYQGHLKTPKINNDQDFDLIINNKLQKSSQLVDKITQIKQQYKNKRQIEEYYGKNYQIGKITQPQVRKINLKGIRKVQVKDGSRSFKITPGCKVLFEIKKLNDRKDNIDTQLDTLVCNSSRNRSETLHQKSMFFQSQQTYKDLSPSNQFRMRKILNKKLFHRLQISKDQVNRFIKLLNELKNELHIILSNQTLKILQEVRQMLIESKIMKMEDLDNIIQNVPIKQNQEIVIKRLREMMV